VNISTRFKTDCFVSIEFNLNMTGVELPLTYFGHIENLSETGLRVVLTNHPRGIEKGATVTVQLRPRGFDSTEADFIQLSAVVIWRKGNICGLRICFISAFMATEYLGVLQSGAAHPAQMGTSGIPHHAKK
jgi:hypothetical protein